jgi:hypothetical protein
MPGRAEIAAVRSAHASMTVRALDRVCVPKEPSCSGLKQTTSQRPKEGAVRSRPMPAMSASPSSGPKEGERFSKTATS